MAQNSLQHFPWLRFWWVVILQLVSKKLSSQSKHATTFPTNFKGLQLCCVTEAHKKDHQEMSCHCKLAIINHPASIKFAFRYSSASMALCLLTCCMTFTTQMIFALPTHRVRIFSICLLQSPLNTSVIFTTGL